MMRPVLWLGRLARFLFVTFVVAGCDPTGGGSGTKPVGPDIRGKWSGEFYTIRLEPPRRQTVTAEIRQDGDAVVVKTSRTGTAANLTGTINAAGRMTMTDAADGETWTTYFGPATASRVRLADFLYDDDLGADSPMYVLDLKRNVASPPAAATNKTANSGAAASKPSAALGGQSAARRTAAEAKPTAANQP